MRVVSRMPVPAAFRIRDKADQGRALHSRGNIPISISLSLFNINLNLPTVTICKHKHKREHKQAVTSRVLLSLFFLKTKLFFHRNLFRVAS